MTLHSSNKCQINVHIFHNFLPATPLAIAQPRGYQISTSPNLVQHSQPQYSMVHFQQGETLETSLYVFSLVESIHLGTDDHQRPAQEAAGADGIRDQRQQFEYLIRS